MSVSGHRKSIAFFITLGSCVVALAIALYIGWIIINWRQGLLLILGVLFFAIIITGVVLNTIFLVREIRRNEQHNTFINAVTHELKTPVASIRLYLETLQTRDITESKREEFYKIMLDDSDRLLRTIEQVLTAGRTGSADRQLNRTLVDLRQLVGDCIALALTRHHLPAESFEYSEVLTGGNPSVMGDEEELKVAVSNLIDNAIKYSGASVRVLVELSNMDAGRLAIRVKDQGVGIPSNELKRIFKRFYRIPGKVAMGVKGTGLGLFIVRSVAAKHGGKAYAESEGAGQGSTFTLQLPCAPPQ